MSCGARFGTPVPPALPDFHHQGPLTTNSTDLTEKCSKDRRQGTYARRAVFTDSDVPTVAQELMVPKRQARWLITRAAVPCGSSVAVRVQPQEPLPGFEGTNAVVEAFFTAANLPIPLNCSSITPPASPPVKKLF